MLIDENIKLLAVLVIPAVNLTVLVHRTNWLQDFLTLPLATPGLLINLHDTLIRLAAGCIAVWILHDLQLLI